MMKNINLIVIVGILLLTSCNSTKYVSTQIKPNEVTDLQPLDVFSYIYFIEKGNKAQFNDSLSIGSKHLFTEVIGDLSPKFPISEEIIYADSLATIKLEKEIGNLCITANKSKKMRQAKIPPTIDSLLHESGKRFGLIALTYGFSRGKGNYGKEIAKGIGMGIATLGMYYQVPIKSSSTVYLIIVDAEKDNIIFSRKSITHDKDPLDKNVLVKQVDIILEEYFSTQDDK